jgi:hypothetical protein
MLLMPLVHIAFPPLPVQLPAPSPFAASLTATQETHTTDKTHLSFSSPDFHLSLSSLHISIFHLIIMLYITFDTHLARFSDFRFLFPLIPQHINRPDALKQCVRLWGI